MPEETQESPALTTEQQQRTHAVMTAAEVLRPRPVRSAVIGNGESSSLAYIDWTEVVRLADYIVTGHSEPTAPMFIAMGWGRNQEEPEDLDVDTRPVDPTTGEATHDEEGDSYEDGEDVGLRVVADFLSLVQNEVPGGRVFSLETINTWTPDQRLAVVEWAGAVHLRASDNDVEIPSVPAILTEDKDALLFDFE